MSSLWPKNPAILTTPASSDTYTTNGVPLSVIGSGGGGGGGGVTQLVAGSNVSLSPAGGTGVVTVNAIGGGGSNTPDQSFNSISVSTVTVGGGSLIMTRAFYNLNVSYPILFQSVSNSNTSTGQLAISKFLWPGVNGSGTVSGLGIYANSTINGSFQPICCGDLYINNSDSSGQGTGLVSYVDASSTLKLEASGGPVTVSSVYISSINGIPWSRLSTLIG